MVCIYGGERAILTAGCPNCKAKRIKCTEELPACNNCVKRRYRCGYLDFPEERLDRLRKKNEKKGADNTDGVNDNELTNSRSRDQVQTPLNIDNTKASPVPITSLDRVLNSLLNTSRNPLIESSPKFDIASESYTGTPQATYHSPIVGDQFSKSYYENSSKSNRSDYLGTALPGFVSPLIPMPQASSPHTNSPQINLPHLNSPHIYLPQIGTPDSPKPYTRSSVFDPIDRLQSRGSSVVGGSHSSVLHAPTVRRHTLPQNPSDDQNSEEPTATDPYDIFARITPINSSLLDPNYFMTKNNLRGTLYQESMTKLLPEKTSQLDDFGFIENEQTVEERDTDHHLGSSNSSDDGNSFEKSKIRYVRHIKSFKPNNTESRETYIEVDPITKYLPGATIQTRNFDKLVIPKNPLLNKYEAFRSERLATYIGENDVLHLPVWTMSYKKHFWTMIFNQAMVVDVYWAFFMDRSLNFILKACDSLLQLKADEKDPSLLTLFIRRDLDVLTRKSYNYYGKLIRKLRSAINKPHMEYPAKISLYASWSCFVHSHATIDTLVLMYNGTSSLLTKIVSEAKTIEDITPTIRMCVQTLSYDCVVSVLPDYSFLIIKEIYADLLDFKQFIIHNPTMNGLGNVFTIRKFIQLENFIQHLIEEDYPKIRYIDNFYKGLTDENANSDGIQYISPSIFFDLLVKWFDSFANECLSVGSHLSPAKRTLYLFFNATGKALSQVFTPLRSVLPVEPVNLLAPYMVFDADTYTFNKLQLTKSQFDRLFKFSTKLIRIIQYFEIRNQILAFHSAVYDFWNKPDFAPYLKCYEPKHDRKVVCNPDIVKIMPAKLDAHEDMMLSFEADRPIYSSNFAMLDKLSNSIIDGEARAKFQHEIMDAKENQLRYLEEKRNGKSLFSLFDYDSGLFKYDFNPQKALEIYYESQGKSIAKAVDVLLEDLRIMISNIDISRREVSKAIHTKFDD